MGVACDQCANDDAVELLVPCDPEAARTVRHELTRKAWTDASQDLRLVASELVNNAVLHSGCTGDHTLEVTLVRSRGNVVISVRDPGLVKDSARVLGPAMASVGGMGLWLVQEMATRWGSERSDGYRVWAELPLN